MINFTLLSVTVFLLAVAGISYGQEKPKVLSLDYCADQFILSLADRQQIMALTRDATGEDSFYRDRARGLPRFDATFEEVLHRTPDIVIRSWGGAEILPLLKRANIAVVTARYGTGTDILFDNLRRVGAKLQQKQRTEKIIADYQRRLISLKKRVTGSPAFRHKLRTIYITPGGVTAGKNTSVNNIIRLAGLVPVSEQIGLEGWQPLPLESLIQNPPDLIIASFFNQDNIHVSGWSLSRHHRIRKMLDSIPTIMVPGRYLSCNGIFAIDAAEYIQNEAERLFK